MPMNGPATADHLGQPVAAVARRDTITLPQELTVEQALAEIRSHGLGERIVYFYVTGDESRLVGVVPTRRLLTAPLSRPLSEIMIRKVVTIPEDASILDAHELMARHRFLALPVVDRAGRVTGVVDVSMFTDESFEIMERERMQELFESIGIRVSQVRDASPLRAFRFRFPWLLATITSGTLCGAVVDAYSGTLARSIVLAFFLTLVLGLGESVSMQSMTVTIQALRSARPTLRWFAAASWREARTALLLGAACGIVVGAIAWAWHGTALLALVIAGGIALAMCAACLFGLSVPAILHAVKLDPKIAAGPVTLGITDICTVFLYFGLATLLL